MDNIVGKVLPTYGQLTPNLWERREGEMFFLGLDFGTSGARSAVLDETGKLVFESSATYNDSANPHHWREALFDLIAGLPADIRSGLSALAIDGTSGTLLATDASLQPTGPALLYNDGRAVSEAEEIAALFPPCQRGWREAPGDFPHEESPPAPLYQGGSNTPYGPTSGLAKRLWLARHFPDAAFCFHQADWLAALLTGKPGITDYHNALKSGYDVASLQWPEWVSSLPGAQWQQTVLSPGETIAAISPEIVQCFGLNPGGVVRAGTTDSIAAFIAAGASRPGEAVTSLGTTLVLKLLSVKRVEDPASGVYSHRFGKLWLAGGASNTGGGVLRQYFSDAQIEKLSASIDPAQPSGLDYYPLPKPGERFPINDPNLLPSMEPRPQNDAAFLHGLLEGMARIEGLGYRKLVELGASQVNRIVTAGGGARNETWRVIRQKLLGFPVETARHTEAAYGAALLAQSSTGVLP